METTEQCVKYARKLHSKDTAEQLIDVVHVFLLLTLNIFHTFF